MPPLPLPEEQPEAPRSPEELFGRLHVVDSRLDNLWSEQADVLREYAAEHESSADVALELPTGSGKTLVGLLLAEWRRLALGERAAFVCPTRQLARQVCERASGYGIDPVLLIGKSEDWETSELTAFQQGNALAVTTYHHVFNRNPRIRAQVLVLDDAHTAEGAVADRWSLSLRREQMRQAYFAVAEEIAEKLPSHHGRAILDDDLDPVARAKVEVLLPDTAYQLCEGLSRVIAEQVENTDSWFPWDAIGGSLETCLIFVSWSEILIRPFIAPTYTQEAFVEANQRIYLSATIGAGGELERSFGRSPIARIAQPSTWDHEGSGRRYIIAPGAGLDGADANRLIQEIVERIERVLFLAPGTWRMNRAATAVIPPDIPRMHADDIENGLSSFTSTARIALLLANRYDGIDLPGDACRLIVMSGLATGTHLQERFLADPLGARHALSERIRTRITQGVGRATRSRRDIAVVVLHGDDLIGFLNPADNRQMLRSEIQAELKIALSTAELPGSEVLSSIDSFLSQDADWQPTEKYLRKYAEDHEQHDPPGADHLAGASEHEISAWREAWGGNYDEAVAAAQRVAAALNHPTMAPYRAWWLALAASWSIIAAGKEATTTIALAHEADMATRRLQWRPRLDVGREGTEVTGDDLLALRAGAATAWLRRRFQSPKLERDLTELESHVTSTDSTSFELGLERLGALLGFQAERPAKESAAPDGAWQDGSRAWILWEAKSEEKDSGEVSAGETRQANTHSAWVRKHYSWPEPERIVTVMASPKESIHPTVGDVAIDNLYLVPLTLVTEVAQEAVALHRQLAGEIVGLSEQDAIDRMAELLNGRGLDTPSLISRLSVRPLRS